jgi:hypothetical protein
MLSVFLIASGLSLFAPSALAFDHFDIEPLMSFILSDWNDSGDVSDSTISCISSADTNSKNPNRRDLAYPYTIKISSLDGSDYSLYLNGNNSAASNAVIAISLSHKDVLVPTSDETLSHDTYDSHTHLGQFRECETAGNNSQIGINISASELETKVPGDYIGHFRISGIGGESGSATDFEDFIVTITLGMAAPMVRITGMDDVSLGSFNGSGDLVADENFCVYASETTYRISINSNSQDAGGNFFINGVTSGDSIPVSLYFADNGRGPGITAVLNTPVVGSGDSSYEFCQGGSNATMTFIVQEQDMREASTGDYLETFTFLVQPE